MIPSNIFVYLIFFFCFEKEPEYKSMSNTITVVMIVSVCILTGWTVNT